MQSQGAAAVWLAGRQGSMQPQRSARCACELTRPQQGVMAGWPATPANHGTTCNVWALWGWILGIWKASHGTALAANQQCKDALHLGRLHASLNTWVRT